jgi:DNA-binding transcriptional ArsR family regulator
LQFFALDIDARIDNHTVVDSLSATIAAVSDPTRRAILHQLALGPSPVRDIARPFRMSQQAVSKHLAYLEKARLIEKKRVGRLHICSLRPEPLQELAEWAEEYRKLWEANYERLDSLLEEMKRGKQDEDSDQG